MILHNHLDLTNQFNLIKAKLEETLPEPRNQEEAQTLLRAAQKNVRELNKKAAALRMLYLEEQAMLLEANDDPKVAESWKQILKAKEMIQMFKKLQSYLQEPAQQSQPRHDTI
jgi:hypothetical protein